MRWSRVGRWWIVAGVMVACSTPPVSVHRPAAPPAPTEQIPKTGPPALPDTAEPAIATAADTKPPADNSVAKSHSPMVYETSSADYRRDAARHIYKRLPERIYKGKMPPLLKAVVVVDIHIEPTGQVAHIDWVRVPKHAPEIKHDIEQAIHQSAPFPAPSTLRRVSYTDTWLWHKSGRFQLDTLTEGQH